MYLIDSLHKLFSAEIALSQIRVFSIVDSIHNTVLSQIDIFLPIKNTKLKFQIYDVTSKVDYVLQLYLSLRKAKKRDDVIRVSR